MQQESVANNHNKVSTDDLLFISNSSLRKKIIDAIETTSGLYIVEQNSIYPTALKKEIRRIIILYSASIIEAVLIFLYYKGKFLIPKTEYIDVNPLSKHYQFDTGFKVVVAKQIRTTRDNRDLMLDVLFNFFLKEKVISKELSTKIKRIKDIRNTFHLSKSRVGLLISSKMVQTSTQATYETIICVKEYLKK